jgi:hypothetical protein
MYLSKSNNSEYGTSNPDKINFERRRGEGRAMGEREEQKGFGDKK